MRLRKTTLSSKVPEINQSAVKNTHIYCPKTITHAGKQRTRTSTNTTKAGAGGVINRSRRRRPVTASFENQTSNRYMRRYDSKCFYLLALTFKSAP
ncbi:hypothetical protein CDAR_320221 [Caerostris darwini]|uniref:Uncharacterized protein n=1 Tax=Caerostris darwini TaxID=1538125 RepID=A0AAV4PK31_9ARAC|nr:hypothetical protein CDAR_320221 [Caerostris darwini]